MGGDEYLSLEEVFVKISHMLEDFGIAKPALKFKLKIPASLGSVARTFNKNRIRLGQHCVLD